MKDPRRTVLTLVAALGVAGCAGGPEDPVVPGELVAYMDGVGLSVEAAAQILAPFERFANNAESARSLAELWVDYTVLADAMARDSLLGNVDLSAVQTLQQREMRVLALRDQVIDVDTTFTEDELRARFEEDDPADQIRARHILIVPPAGATPTERDSVRAIADSLRQEILAGGAEFEAVARLHSADITANDGGDLGLFGRGEMVPEFEQVVFDLEEGELSGVFQTSFGYHIARVDERVGPSFEDARDRYRRELASRMRAEAERDYIGGLADSADVTIPDGAAERAARIVNDPWTPLDRAAADEVLVTWNDGAFTAGDLREFLIAQPRDNILQIRAQGDFPGLLRTFALQEVLLAEAEREGVDVGSGQWELTEPVYRQQAGANARTLGLFPVTTQEGESEEAAMQRQVRRALTFNLAGEIGLLALGPAIGPLRAERDVMVLPGQLPAVVARVEAIRSTPGFQPFVRPQPQQDPDGPPPVDPGAP